MRSHGKIWGTVVLSIYALCGLALLAFTVPATGLTAKSVATGSMQPAISTGSLVIIQDVPLGQLKVGDIITYRTANNKETITHRIVKISKKDGVPFFTTKGDANGASDPEFVGGRIVGKVSMALPFVGYAVDFMRSFYGLVLAIYLPALVVIVGEIRRLAAYYRSAQVFRLPWVKGSLYKPRAKSKLVGGAQAALVCLVLAGVVALPAYALFGTNAVTLASTSISVIAPEQVEHILIRRIEFQCADDNTFTVNKLPSILFHNPTATDTPTGSWYLQSQNGRIATFLPKTVFDAHSDYDIEPDLQAGVNYNGDYLALFDSNNNLVDAVSWGTDTTYLNPSLAGMQDGTVFRRIDLTFDTNTAADWAVTVSPCVDED